MWWEQLCKNCIVAVLKRDSLIWSFAFLPLIPLSSMSTADYVLPKLPLADLLKQMKRDGVDEEDTSVEGVSRLSS